MVTGATDPNAFDGTLLIGWDGECVHWIALDSNGIADHGVDSEIGSLTELSHRFSGAAAVAKAFSRVSGQTSSRNELIERKMDPSVLTSSGDAKARSA